MKDGKHLVLCVDDDADILDSLKLVLEANGYAFLGAHNAEDGLKVYKAEKPDFVVVDLMMEEVDAGTGLVKDLKLEGNTAPVYMLTSVGDELNKSIDSAALGLSGVFQKPVDNDTLLSTLKTKLKA